MSSSTLFNLNVTLKNLLLSTATCLWLSACDNTPATPAPPPMIESRGGLISQPTLSELDRPLLALVKTLKLTGDPAIGRDYPPPQDSIAQLGKQLFFTPLSINGTKSSCADCHQPTQGGTQRTALSSGLPTPPNPIPIAQSDYLFHRGHTILPLRNAPSTFNTTLWDHYLFHDGRITALTPTVGANGNIGGIATPSTQSKTADADAGGNLVQAAAQLTVLKQSSLTQRLNLPNPESLPPMFSIITDELLTQGEQSFSPTQEWLGRFRQGFNTPEGLPLTLLTHQRTAEALAAYMRSQIFVNNPWKAYLEGDSKAISETAKEGALLFFRSSEQGGFNCVKCHSGDTFTDEQFYRTLMPPITLKRPSRTSPQEIDYGRWFVTREDKDKFLFRTPSLLNVAETGPWGHNGAYPTLSGIVRHMLDPVNEVSRYDTSVLDKQGLAADYLEDNIRQMLVYGSDLISQKYSQKELQALIAFLYTLTDPCIKSNDCLKPWLPDHNEPSSGLNTAQP